MRQNLSRGIVLLVLLMGMTLEVVAQSSWEQRTWDRLADRGRQAIGRLGRAIAATEALALPDSPLTAPEAEAVLRRLNDIEAEAVRLEGVYKDLSWVFFDLKDDWESLADNVDNESNRRAALGNRGGMATNEDTADKNQAWVTDFLGRLRSFRGRVQSNFPKPWPADLVAEALKAGDWTRAKTLVAALPDIDAVTRVGGRTSLYLAIQYQAPTDLVSWILSRGADPNRQGSAAGTPNLTPLHLCAFGDHLFDAYASLLLKAGANLEARTTDEGLTPFLEACTVGTPGTIRSFLKAGADPQARDNAGKGALHLTLSLLIRQKGEARAAWLAERLDVLTGAGVPLDQKAGDTGRTPLVTVLDLPKDYFPPENLDALVKVLIDRGASVTVKDGQGKDALDHLLARDTEDTSSARFGPLVVRLVLAGADPNRAHPASGYPPLAYAILAELPVAPLLDKGARADWVGGDFRHTTLPLLLLLTSDDAVGGLQTLKLLLDRGASPQAAPQGAVPLVQAAQSDGWDAAVAELLKRGAPVNQVGPGGKTALITATIWGATAVAQRLKKAGADPSVVDGAGKKAADYAPVVEAGRKLTSFTGIPDSGKARTWPDPADRSLVLVHFSTWSPASVDALADLVEAQRAYRNRGLTVVLVGLGSGVDPHSILSRYDLTWSLAPLLVSRTGPDLAQTFPVNYRVGTFLLSAATGELLAWGPAARGANLVRVLEKRLPPKP